MIALPFTSRSEFDVIKTNPEEMAVSLRRQRFPRDVPYRSFLLRYGPLTLGALTTEILSTVRATKGGALTATITLPVFGSWTGRFGPIRWINRSPTACEMEIEFEGVPGAI